MVLVLLETNNPPEINSAALCHHLMATSSPPNTHLFHRVPWEHAPPTGATPERTEPTHDNENCPSNPHPMLRPGLLWLTHPDANGCTTPNRVQPTDLPPQITHKHSVPPCMLALGAAPPTLQQHISQYNTNDHPIHPDITDKITKIIRNVSLELFRKDEGYHKWRKKHSWRRGEHTPVSH